MKQVTRTLRHKPSSPSEEFMTALNSPPLGFHHGSLFTTLAVLALISETESPITSRNHPRFCSFGHWLFEFRNQSWIRGHLPSRWNNFSHAWHITEGVIRIRPKFHQLFTLPRAADHKYPHADTDNHPSAPKERTQKIRTAPSVEGASFSGEPEPGGFCTRSCSRRNSTDAVRASQPPSTRGTGR